MSFLAAVLMACSATVPATTEALAPIAASTTSPVGAPTTVPGGNGLSAEQQAAVDQLIASHAAGDADAILASWQLPANTRNLWEDELLFDIAVGGHWSDPQCGRSLAGQARCDILYTNDLLTTLGAPLQNGSFRIGVGSGGAITSWFYEPGSAVTAQALQKPFFDWVADNHPDSVDVMFTPSGFVRYTPDSRELWVERIAEFQAEAASG